MTADHLAEVVDLGAETMTPAEKRTAARRLAAADPTLTGGDIGRRFGMDARWGRRQAEAARGTKAFGSTDREAPPVTAPGHIEVTAPAPPVIQEAPPTDRPAAPVPRCLGTPVRAVDRADRWHDRGLAAGRLVVLLVAAALSYSHMRALGLTAGGDEWQATLWPLSVDGLLVVALLHLQRARRHGGGTLAPWCALVAALGASLAANVASADPTVLGRAWASWPPVALLTIEALGRDRGRR